jgi:hypothetical protein
LGGGVTGAGAAAADDDDGNRELNAKESWGVRAGKRTHIRRT